MATDPQSEDAPLDARSRIAEAVWLVIAEKGIGGVSVRSVAAAAEVSPGLVQHYFPAKSQLLHASMQRMIERAASAYAAADGQEVVLQAVAHAIPTTPASRRGVAVWYSFVAAAATDPKAAEILAQAKSAQEAEVARVIDATATVSDPTASARRLIALADGLAARVLIGDLEADDALVMVRAAASDTASESPGDRL